MASKQVNEIGTTILDLLFEKGYQVPSSLLIEINTIVENGTKELVEAADSVLKPQDTDPFKRTNLSAILKLWGK